mmetsp:Transcript_19599/g.40935  ORF Transcript_19599/g.40935 Transcript_19599/m.40935 type:complete len:348 (+) Transcript_19599:17-1060(+)
MSLIARSASLTLSRVSSRSARSSVAAMRPFSEKAEEIAVENEAPKVPKKVAGVGNIYDIAKQINPDLPADLKEIKTLDRAHDKQGYRSVAIRQMGRGSMTSSTGAGRNWVLRFSNTEAQHTDGTVSEGTASDRWDNPLMGYISSKDPMSNLVNNLNFPTPQSAMDFALKRGWDYTFPDYATMVFKDNGDIYDPTENVPLYITDPKTNAKALNPSSSRVSKTPEGNLTLREWYTTHKVPPFFDDAVTELYGSHSNKMDPQWPEDNWRHRKEKDNAEDYGENFLPKAVKHHLKTNKMSSDFFQRDLSGASHYFRPLKYHGDGIVRQHGPNQDPDGKEIAKDVKGWRSRR